MNLESLFQTTLLLASVGLGTFCVVLARRLRRLNDLETGLGGAIAIMAAEVDRLERAIRGARDEATQATEALSREIATARNERALLELRKRIHDAAGPGHPQHPPRRLRKRSEAADA